MADVILKYDCAGKQSHTSWHILRSFTVMVSQFFLCFFYSVRLINNCVTINNPQLPKCAALFLHVCFPFSIYTKV